MIKTSVAVLGPILAILMVFTVSATVNGQVDVARSQDQAPMETETVQATPTAVAPAFEAETGTATPTPDLQMSGMSGGCPMMSGAMTGNASSMTGMSGMAGMSGMTGTSGMSGMNDMSSMTDMSSMSNMSGGAGISNVSGMSSTSAMEAARLFQIMTGQGVLPYTTDPWWLLGWLVLFVSVLALIAGLTAAVVLFVRGWRRRQPAQTGA
jgi:hypothetical protein